MRLFVYLVVVVVFLLKLNKLDGVLGHEWVRFVSI